MSKVSLKEGRVRQKLETRSQILEAAREIMKAKKKLSLEEVARQAGISRATIYRYFPNVDLLIIEASLDIHYVSPEELAEKVASKTIDEGFLYIQEYFNKLTLTHEPVFRQYLSAVLQESLASKKKLRGGRRIAALETLMATYEGEMDEETLENLKNISAILMVDAIMTGKDVCGLASDKISHTLRWGLEMILKGIQADMKESA
ncbi:TetR/AcrR family transcriptional regulator [Zeaxanthinibacter enoshimensis]|uniref:AcrR family transcriptional regulator n=1 Tax=Zeaxanthinibacter enoshimensis TaxID=392009 RepID=A0A4R6TPC8_9FLAO|nr:TetR/AcrR family transcriptional regulator [Zeaxanthinibacter enoshimensis]TDQ33145.1 AcrR family transcriptional regulator [Zeaxanthinibacter enoshimensis]